MANAKNNNGSGNGGLGKEPDGGNSEGSGREHVREGDNSLDPERLCDAAEAALRAVAEASERNGGQWVYPTDLLLSASPPSCLRDFTRYEVEQASMFLVRMGAIEPRQSPRRAA